MDITYFFPALVLNGKVHTFITFFLINLNFDLFYSSIPPSIQVRKIPVTSKRQGMLCREGFMNPLNQAVAETVCYTEQFN